MAEVELHEVCVVMMLKDKHNSINISYISKAKTSGRYSSNVYQRKVFKISNTFLKNVIF